MDFLSARDRLADWCEDGVDRVYRGLRFARGWASAQFRLAQEEFDALRTPSLEARLEGALRTYAASGRDVPLVLLSRTRDPLDKSKLLGLDIINKARAAGGLALMEKIAAPFLESEELSVRAAAIGQIFSHEENFPTGVEGLSRVQALIMGHGPVFTEAIVAHREQIGVLCMALWARMDRGAQSRATELYDVIFTFIDQLKRQQARHAGPSRAPG